MYKFMQRNRKKMLAVFAVGLMIVFILPQVAFDPQRGTSQEVIAHMGDEEVTAGEARQAMEQWRVVMRDLPFEMGAVALVADDIERNPELFLLLQKEARQMGLRVPDAQVTEAMQRMRQQSLMFGRQPPSNLEALRPALTNLMLASTLIERTADGFKASQPRVAHELAVTDQRVKLDLVHFLVDDFKKQVPEPTAEQLQKQFDEFKNTPPGAPTDQNPFGFGYLEPARVKLLYLTIPAAEVAKKLRGEPDSEQYFEWRTKAVREFRANPARYPASQPASQPTTNTTTQPTTQAAATQPAPRELTKELEAKIIDQLIQPELERQVERIAASVADRLRVDYEARQRKADAVPDFGTLAYLDRVKADVQQKHGVTLGVSEISQPKTEKELAELKGVGRSTAGEQPFGTFVMRWAEPLVSTALRASPEVLSVNEPTPVFRDLDGNAYVAQLREATPPHAPANLDAVKQAVQEDVRTKLAFELAVAAAK